MLGEGKPLIILHGLFGMLDNWFTLGKKFSENFTVYLIDQRNHGQSPHSDEWNYKVMSDDLLEFFDEHHLSKATIIGHSMGGKTAMQFAGDHNDRVKKLVVVDIAPRSYPVHHKNILDALLSIDLENLKSRNEADAMLSKYISDFGTKQFLLKNLTRKENDNTKFEWKFNLPVIAKNIHEVGVQTTGDSTVPALFIRGENSNYIKNSDEAEIQKLYPNSEIISINSGHWVHAEKPEEFYSSVMKFLKD
ncbi:MAG: Esterase YbfF [Bacteroidia bacterium]|nr:Esterase YbfF [Bacteroidia bacterium]